MPTLLSGHSCGQNSISSFFVFFVGVQHIYSSWSIRAFVRRPDALVPLPSHPLSKGGEDRELFKTSSLKTSSLKTSSLKTSSFKTSSLKTSSLKHVTSDRSSCVGSETINDKR